MENVWLATDGAFLIDTASGGLGGSITIEDEGIVVATDVETINIVGTGHNAVDMGSGRVNIYAPELDLVSHFNTNDGTNTAIVADIPTTNRHISSPISESNPFKINTWTGGDMRPVTRDNTLTYSTINLCIFEDLESDIEVIVSDIPGGVVYSSQVRNNIFMNGSAITGGIAVVISGWAVEGSKYKAIITVNLDLDVMMPEGGRFSVRITHSNGGVDYVKTQNNLYYDIDTQTSTLNNLSIVENTINSAKYLSGIRYYDLTDTFDVGIADIDNINHMSYPTNFIDLNMSTFFGIADVFLQGASLNNWDTLYNNIDASYTSPHAITSNDFRYIGTGGTINAFPIDWSPETTIYSAAMALLIDTFVPESDELSEYFTDETYRKTIADIAWDSLQSIITYDGAAHAQVTEGILRIPNIDYSLYNPLGNPNYLALNSNINYYRNFIDITASVRGSSSLNITGFTLQNLIDEDIELWFLIPGKWTNWCYAHSSDEFDFGTFNGGLTVSQPIRVNSSTSNNINISFGTLGLDVANDYFRMRLVINDSSLQPSSILVSW